MRQCYVRVLDRRWRSSSAGKPVQSAISNSTAVARRSAEVVSSASQRSVPATVRFSDRSLLSSSPSQRHRPAPSVLSSFSRHWLSLWTVSLAWRHWSRWLFTFTSYSLGV